jgi:hypothetical protein
MLIVSYCIDIDIDNDSLYHVAIHTIQAPQAELLSTLRQRFGLTPKEAVEGINSLLTEKRIKIFEDPNTPKGLMYALVDEQTRAVDLEYVQRRKAVCVRVCIDSERSMWLAG